jgi:hypothetical protein
MPFMYLNFFNFKETEIQIKRRDINIDGEII